MRKHVVIKGETLAQIAEAYYHDPAAWAVIYQHNAHYIQNPNHLDAGQVLVVPHLVNPHLLERVWN